ncbi:abortive infection protein [Lactiplantibacillus pentosus]|nr:abortive infection protein [Lactiplantibacillus pentosus]
MEHLGGECMTLYNQAKVLLHKYNGTFTRRQAISEGIVAPSLSRMVEQELIERVGPGIYADPMSFEDEFLIAQLRLSRGIFCKETALYLYNMTDRTPNFMEMAFPKGYKSNYFDELRIKPYRQIDALYGMGITTIETPYGNQVRVYDIERTLCDIIRPPHVAQDEVVRQAMQGYVQRPEKDFNRLMKYAKNLKVDAKIKTYMSVLG